MGGVIGRGLSPCSGLLLGTRRAARSGSHRQRVHSVGPGQRRTSGDSDDVENPWKSAAGRGTPRDCWPSLVWRL